MHLLPAHARQTTGFLWATFALCLLNTAYTVVNIPYGSLTPEITKDYQERTTLNGFRFERGPETGSPLLVDLPYWFECRVTDTIARGDHTVFVGEVVDAGVSDEAATPLLLRSTGMNSGG